jgi:N-succinyldiaminopimelate aminotransferase
VPVNPRYETLEEYPFTRLNKLLSGVTPRANEPPILMSVGEPQHEPPDFMARVIAENAMLWNRYPPMAGTPSYRNAASAWLQRRYRLPDGMLQPERHVAALSGTKEGLYMIAAVAVPETKAGTRPVALMPNPYYLVYSGGGHMAGAETVALDATDKTGFLPDLDAIPEALLARTAIFYLCSPANPQGACADLAYLQKAIRLARAHDFVLAVDECYSEIYDRAPPAGGLEACASLGGDLKNVLVFHSLSKRSNAAGLRCGFVAGDADWLARFQALRAYGGAQVPLPLQAAAVALWRDENHVEANRALYRRKFDVCEDLLKGRFGFYRPAGGFFLWLDVGDGEQAAVKLWREAALRSLPGPYIGRPNQDGVNPGQRYIRLAIVHDDDTVAAGMRRLLQIL